MVGPRPAAAAEPGNPEGGPGAAPGPVPGLGGAVAASRAAAVAPEARPRSSPDPRAGPATVRAPRSRAPTAAKRPTSQAIARPIKPANAHRRARTPTQGSRAGPEFGPAPFPIDDTLPRPQIASRSPADDLRPPGSERSRRGTDRAGVPRSSTSTGHVATAILARGVSGAGRWRNATEVGTGGINSGGGALAARANRSWATSIGGTAGCPASTGAGGRTDRRRA